MEDPTTLEDFERLLDSATYLDDLGNSVVPAATAERILRDAYAAARPAVFA